MRVCAQNQEGIDASRPGLDIFDCTRADYAVQSHAIKPEPCIISWRAVTAIYLIAVIQSLRHARHPLKVLELELLEIPPVRYTCPVELDDDPSSPAVAAELVGTSISSDGPALRKVPPLSGRQSICAIFRRSRARLCQHRGEPGPYDRTIPRHPRATLMTLKSFVVENGRPGAAEI